MKHLPTLLIILSFSFFTCSQPQTKEKTSKTQTGTSAIETRTQANETETNLSYETETSTYDNSKFTEQIADHRNSLKQLSDSNIFSQIQNEVIKILPGNHQEYFKTKVDYELLFAAKGDLFQENKEDFAFEVYDRQKQCITILVYNDAADKYFELYRDIKVLNGLQDADCSYGAFGTLDFQLADEIASEKDYLVKKPMSYLEAKPLKITDLSKDEDFVLDRGCFAPQVNKRNLSNSLCISTSSVYNNWECIKYNKTNNTFLKYYGQAFAD